MHEEKVKVNRAMRGQFGSTTFSSRKRQYWAVTRNKWQSNPSKSTPNVPCVKSYFPWKYVWSVGINLLWLLHFRAILFKSGETFLGFKFRDHIYSDQVAYFRNFTVISLLFQLNIAESSGIFFKDIVSYICWIMLERRDYFFGYRTSQAKAKDMSLFSGAGD